jgi:hypothetical protein
VHDEQRHLQCCHRIERSLSSPRHQVGLHARSVQRVQLGRTLVGRAPGLERFSIEAIWSPATEGGARPQSPDEAGMPLACAGYGSVLMVTAAMGFAAASDTVVAVLRGPFRPWRAESSSTALHA